MAPAPRAFIDVLRTQPGSATGVHS
jgi:hypothetical protein